MYSIENICAIIKGHFLQKNADDRIEELLYDSRRVHQPAAALFFALVTPHNNGHLFITDAYKRGIRNFVVSETMDQNELKGSNVILVSDGLMALQALGAYHRQQFSYPVIGITGSNGKTIVKEWLYQLLDEDYSIVRSPKSFNSQLGVPLSVWQMNSGHEMGIFEAGISKPREMKNLAPVIQPTIGILTNIGEAHSEGFRDNEQKLKEKLLLFKGAEFLIARSKDLSSMELKGIHAKLLLWGHGEHDDFIIGPLSTGQKEISIKHNGRQYNVNCPFTDEASIENLITCICVMIFLGYSGEMIGERVRRLHAIDMRLQLNHSINNCVVINDSYSADVTSLRIALDFLKQQSSKLTRTVILSEFFESGRPIRELYAEIAGMIGSYSIKKLIVIGETISGQIRARLDPSIELHTCLSTDDFIKDFKSSFFSNEIILIKGARRFQFERVAQLFERKLHETVLEINLNALAHNLKEYQKLLKPGTRVMAMVKAFSYGSGGAEIASVLQYHNTDYLGVAYADEGVELVKAGISIPVMVMNTEESSFQSLVDHDLQPVLYSLGMLQRFSSYIQSQGLSSYPVHIEIETGMNRLGFNTTELDELGAGLSRTSLCKVRSVFTHLAASEDPAQDAFTFQQAEIFRAAIATLGKYIPYPFLKHMSNSAATVRHPQLQMDMVRLGIGLYGVEIDQEHALDLRSVATLRSTIAQLKHLKKGESVSYNRRGVVRHDSVIATVRIGYADGYSRRLGNGVGKMLVKGILAPVIGTVCMDMTMIDVTGIKDLNEGDEVIVFGPDLPVQELARWMHTIPYEIMTGISQRVKRIYFHE